MFLQGVFALAFGELLRKLWLPGQSSIAPRAFKGNLARFAPQFSGYNQHDSQVSTIFIELLLFYIVAPFLSDLSTLPQLGCYCTCIFSV